MRETTVLIRLGLATLFGLIIGLEREHHHKSAGATTHGLVALASALLVLISEEGFRLPDSGMVAMDAASRVAASIIPGIGFLGAGAIMIRGGQISGLTTSAGILVTASVGMAFGSGLYFIGAASAAMVCAILLVTRWLDVLRARRDARSAAEGQTEEQQAEGPSEQGRDQTQ